MAPLGGAIGAVGGLATNALGIGEKRQLRQQQKLNEQAAGLNYEYGEKAASNAHERQLEILGLTHEQQSYKSRAEDARAAGLNVGLLASGGLAGAGGMGSTGGGVQGEGAGALQPGKAQTPAENQAIANQTLDVGLRALKNKAEIDVLKSEAEKNRADAGKKGAEKTTEDDKREVFIELMRQQGIGQFLDNVKERIRVGDIETGDENEGTSIKNNVLEALIFVKGKNLFSEKEAADIAVAYAAAEQNKALAELNTEKKKGYWQELLNETIKAEAYGSIAKSKEVEAAAKKLATEWETGEYTNWKTWAEIAQQVTGTVVSAIK